MERFVALVALLAFSVKDFKGIDAAITSDGCGTTKTCYRDPENCVLTDSGCRFFSWAPGAQSGSYTFEMSGGTGDPQYIAMALARESKMANADLYYCDGKAVRTGAIQALHYPPAYYDMSNGLTQISAAIENNTAQCAFMRPTSVVKNITNDETYDFDIGTVSYYFLGAVGPMMTGTTKIMKHDVWHGKSSSSINFSAAPAVSDGCGSSKTCYHSPKDCVPGTDGCYFYSWRKVNSETYEFEIVGGAGAGKYAALALGTESKMVNADMYYCDGQAVRSGVIRQVHVEPVYVTTTGLVLKSANILNGVSYCLFTRPASVQRTISDNKEKTFDLNKEKYYLLAASGPTRDGGNKISVHTWKDKSSEKLIGTSSGRQLNAHQPALLAFMALLIMKASREFTT